MAELLNQIEEYWSTRVEGYSEVNEKEINRKRTGFGCLKNVFRIKQKQI